MFAALVPHICIMKPSTTDLTALKEQLKALDSGYVGLLAIKLEAKYAESYIRQVLAGDRTNNAILDAAMELLVELTKRQAERLKRLQLLTSEPAA